MLILIQSILQSKKEYLSKKKLLFEQYEQVEFQKNDIMITILILLFMKIPIYLLKFENMI